MKKATKYPKLFEHGKIGTMECKNRVIMPAMGTVLANETYGVTDRLMHYYVERAKGDVGLIVTENAFVALPGGSIVSPRLSVSNVAYIPGLNSLVETVQSYGAKIAIQLNHPGIGPDGLVLGPSTIPMSKPKAGLPPKVPKAMTEQEIEAAVQAFINGSRISKMAGADAVELHCAHGYLLSQFLSPFSNKRTDKYGGSTEGRIRILIEVIQGIKRELGKDFPVMVKFNANDNVPNGLELEEAKIIAQMMEEAGVDAIEVSAGLIGYSLDTMIQPMYLDRGYNVHLAEAIKQCVDIPIVAVGSITDPDLAEHILEEGKADFIALGRSLLADPYFPQKAKEGRTEDIRRCIRCCVGCVGRVRDFLPVSCTVNASVGRENEFAITAAAKAKKIVVVGGGPAGMEAARVAALRGHNVTIFERAKKLGGQLLLAALPPYKEEIEIFRRYLCTQIEKLGVNVKVGEEATFEVIKRMEPDVVIVATGAVPIIPDIPGIELDSVATAEGLLLGKVKLGQEVVIVGAGLVGCEIAHKLSREGKKVTIVEMLDEIMAGVTEIVKKRLTNMLDENDVIMRTATCVTAIEKRGVRILDKLGTQGIIKADNVVLALGSRPQSNLVTQLEEEFRVYAIGDCVKPRNIFYAVHEGSFVARQV